MPVLDQARPLQHTQMLGHRRLGNAGLHRQHPHRLFPLAAQPFKDGAAGGVSQGLEQ